MTNYIDCCYNHKEYAVTCERKTAFKKPGWFGVWMNGNPERGISCEKRIIPAQDNLF
ncbi:MAG: hypothetical protein NT007_09780 [Candidatus Kapabacteria bacterium]|nr:hypothetical protein [Candidatus Kapabacteria bacterium]